MKELLAEIQDKKQLVQSLNLAQNIVTKDYLYELKNYEVEELPEQLKDLNLFDYSRIYKITKIVSDKKEDTIDKLVTVLNAAYTCKATIVTLICGNEATTEYYIGVVNKDIENGDITTQGETVYSVMSGNFSGMEIEQVKPKIRRQLLHNTVQYDYITSISGIASVRNEKKHSYEKYVQGIEHLVDSLQGKIYNIVVIADPVDMVGLEETKAGYESLYTQISPFLKSTLSFNESESITYTSSHTEGFSKTVGESTSMTQNYSKTSGWSESETYGTSTNTAPGRLVGTIAGGAVAAGALALGVVNPAITIGGLAVAGGMIGDSLVGSKGESTSSQNSRSGSETNSYGNTKANQNSKTDQSSDTESEAEGQSHGRTVQISNENKTVKNLLHKIDKNLERLEECESYGAFNCATYVISPDPQTNSIVANGYNALMKGDNSSLQSSYINLWSAEKSNGRRIQEYLQKFSHPIFKTIQNEEVLVTPACMVNPYELAVNMGFPKKSIVGLPVYEMASFGRNIFESYPSEEERRRIELGKIYHMGKEQSMDLSLNVKSLAMHTFITGSTGCGKSNTIYQILGELKKQGIHYLVIEPAKGEYKNIFGNDGTKVYGTNPFLTPLLKINPFRFPKGIHILEHIDRLIEIFNVCWPMYAAMPAVLKDAVERAYTGAGWDLTTSMNQYDENLFPTFEDVLIELTEVVNQSAFSQEVKDNYIGSLATRVRSLTNGIYREIFDDHELGDEALFDDNVIVDLSRVGSVETKSMIMGILVMRLQEYRMISGKMDADLGHVTVLEEAHNLLKRTSTEQSSESSNLLGKSVEMLANAIAEVRTYGEGFIIADQAPGLLDMSVIRNTNTKIIMRLPDAQDRELVGKSANLTEDQIKELAKLPTGVAAVYQNNWLEPVLGKIEKYKKPIQPYQYQQKFVLKDSTKEFKTKTLKLLLKTRVKEPVDQDIDELIKLMDSAKISVKNKIILGDIFKDCKEQKDLELWKEDKFKELSNAVTDLLELKVNSEIERVNDFDELTEKLICQVQNETIDLPKPFALAAAQCLMKDEAVKREENQEIYAAWITHLRNKGIY